MRNGLIKVSLFINYFLFAVLLNSVGTVILQVQNSFGVGERAASVLEAFKDLPIAITSFLVASFIVRIGYKRTMQIALVFIGLVCLVLPQVPTFWMVKLLFAATGASFALIKVSVFATLGLITNDQRGHASLMNFLESFFMVGVLSGYFIFSQFVDDQDPGSLGWVRVYYVLAAISFLALVLLSFAPLDESRIQSESPTSFSEDFRLMLALCARGLVLIFIASAFLYVLIEQSIMSWLPTFNSRILQLPASLSIEMASILAASTALGRFVAGLVLKRFDWLKVLVLGLGLSAILVLVILPLAEVAGQEPVTSWGNAPIAAFVFPCIGFCLAPIYPAINSVILSALPARQHAPMSGLIVVFSALGGTSGSLLMGFLFSTIGGKAAFYFSLLPLSLLFIALFQFKKRLAPAQAMTAGGVHGG